LPQAFPRFRPEDFLKVGRDIYDNFDRGQLELRSGLESAWVRTAISRAYYGAFLFVNHELNFHFTGKDAHDRLVSELMRMSRPYKEIGSKLDALRRRRIEADYLLSYIPSIPHLRWAVKTAEHIIENAKDILKRRSTVRP